MNEQISECTHLRIYVHVQKITEWRYRQYLQQHWLYCQPAQQCYWWCHSLQWWPVLEYIDVDEDDQTAASESDQTPWSVSPEPLVRRHPSHYRFTIIGTSMLHLLQSWQNVHNKDFTIWYEKICCWMTQKSVKFALFISPGSAETKVRRSGK